MLAASVAGAPIDVAVGVLIRDDGSFLLAQRPDGKPMAGWWEFPGGKLEAGESVFDALVREFREELDLRIVAAHPWVQRVVTYPHATVRLHFWRSFGDGRGWTGAPRSSEGQAFRWESIDHLMATPWLKGAEPVKRWMRLPSIYAISNAGDMGVDRFLDAVERRIADGSLRILQLREPALSAAAFARLFDAVHARCAAAGVRLLINSRHDPSFGVRADGIHLNGRDLMRCDARPAVDWCMASCHVADEMKRAGTLGLDAVVLGPVRTTASHPGVDGIGWARFAALARGATVPVYALGGLGREDVDTAIGHGAHGVAMIRDMWRDDDGDRSAA